MPDRPTTGSEVGAAGGIQPPSADATPDIERPCADATFAMPLRPGFCREAALRLFARLPISSSDQSMLRRRYDEPELPYHGAAHIGVIWLRFLAHGGSVDDVGMALAIAFHDAVYQPRSRDNEVRSAALLRTAAGSGPTVDWAAAAILATSDHLGYAGDDPRIQRLLDLDLTPLAEAPDLVVANWAALHHEVRQSVTDIAWAEEQCRFFAAMLSQSSIYRSGLAEIYDAPARRNLTAGTAHFSAILKTASG